MMLGENIQRNLPYHMEVGQDTVESLFHWRVSRAPVNFHLIGDYLELLAENACLSPSLSQMIPWSVGL